MRNWHKSFARSVLLCFAGLAAAVSSTGAAATDVFSFTESGAAQNAAEAYSHFCLQAAASPSPAEAYAARANDSSWTEMSEAQITQILGKPADEAWVVLTKAQRPFVVYFSEGQCGVNFPSAAKTGMVRKFDTAVARFFAQHGKTYWPKPMKADPQDTRYTSITQSFSHDGMSHAMSLHLFTDTDASENALLTYAVN